MKPKVLVLFYLCFFNGILVKGSDYYFRNMAVEDGLSQNMVYSIMQDKTGFMWFGTMDGLNRYDGIQFRIFKKGNGEAYTIGSNKIFSILQNEDEKIWIGTANGIYIYDPLYESFSRFNVQSDEGGEIDGIVRDLKSDKEGNVWIIVQDKGVYCYCQGNLKSYLLGDTHVRELLFDTRDNLWVATHGRGLLKINTESAETAQFLLDEEKIDSPDNSINVILSYNSHYMLVGTVNKGVQKFDLENETFTPFLEKGNDGKPLFVRCMIKTENQELWIGTETGIYIYDLKSEKYLNLKHIYNDPYSLSDNAIHSLFQDREGGIWVGTFFGGICYFNYAFSQFEKYYPIVGENSISGKSISEFCEDSSKKIWIGTEDAGLNWFDPLTKSFGKSFISAKNIHSLLYDKNRLWVGTFSEGLYVSDLLTGEIKSYKNSLSENSIKDDNIYSIYKDSSGKIWIGSMTGLQYFDEISSNFRRINEDMINNQVNDILEDYKGILWFATIGDGIFSYNRFSDEWFHYPSTVNNTDDTGKSIICLLQDKKNRLWIGTEGAGLGIYDVNTNSFKSAITSDTGLPNDVIYRLIEDNKGYIWGSTNKGIFRLNPDNLDVTVYTHSNGLLGDQFNYKSGFKSYDGKIYFGGVKGFVGFMPDNLGINEYIPPVVLNSFQIQNKEVTLTEKNSPLEKSITYTHSIRVPHNVSVFSIGFASLSYTYPGGNMYAYKLEGRDNEWIYANQAHQVNYSDLSPGNYVFRVKGSNSDGIWNETETSLKIDVLPPWYRTFAAYLFYIVMISGIISFSIYIFVRRTKRRNKLLLMEIENTKEKELYTAKIDFFTHITHEIRTPLSLIKIPLEDVMKNIDINNPNWDNLTIVQRNVDRLLKLVNELMDFRKTESQSLSLNFVKTDVVGIIKDTISRFKPSMDAKRILFNNSFSIGSIYADVDREVFTKIVSNLFSNALKQSLTVIEMVFSHNEKNFTIKIENDGDTIPDEYLKKIFEPFFKLNRNVQGTGIGLAFVKSLVELHKGAIYCDNSKPDRTIFVMTLPINQDYSINIDDEQTDKMYDTSLKTSHTLPIHPKKPNHTILTVEDNEEFQKLLYSHLTKKYHVLQSRNGMEAMSIMDKENVDVVICDIMMPVMDGLEFCKTMKENIKYSHIPVILLTSRTNLESKIEGINCGADEYIEKPYSVDYLMARIDNLLENRRKMQEAFKNSPELAFKSITHSKADEEFLQKLIDIIHNNLDEPDLNIDKLAEEMALSRSTLYRKVKNVSELSPNDFILLIRLKKAAELIKQKQYQINEIAYMVGFSSPNYFSKCFFKQFGVTPKDF
ncbi:hybrid sensor histidine kinase/response regulator transcription factor [Proteiniphilum sp. X52]|uniref:hybrid sensor histidine kinase/response regulator transcription factor n=1 Tax=Proteiniphilum sp. X52 TaxID=2382159 RepID=UPI000F09C909|nr:hybrid sensor histidine kinase/response regulator transcription factor [Proteiniphilum sp. X52]RNC66175.1 hybrid sensor histidine kinase/response regulator [Proteiniphilum sp. X52]